MDSAGLVQGRSSGVASNPAVRGSRPRGSRPNGRPGDAVRRGTRSGSSLPCSRCRNSSNLSWVRACHLRCLSNVLVNLSHYLVGFFGASFRSPTRATAPTWVASSERCIVWGSACDTAVELGDASTCTVRPTDLSCGSGQRIAYDALRLGSEPSLCSNPCTLRWSRRHRAFEPAPTRLCHAHRIRAVPERLVETVGRRTVPVTSGRIGTFRRFSRKRSTERFGGRVGVVG